MNLLNHMIKILLLKIVLVISVNASHCYESSIIQPSPFMGNDGEIFKLVNGSLWEVKYEYKYMYAYYPHVIVCPNKSIMIVEDTKLNVERLK